MSDLDHQVATLRRRLYTLNMAPQGAKDDMAWRIIRACLNACFMEYIELVERRTARELLLQGREIGQTESAVCPQTRPRILQGLGG